MFLYKFLLTVALIYSSFAQDEQSDKEDLTPNITTTTTPETTTLTTTTPTTTTSSTTTPSPTTITPITTEAPVKYSYYNVTNADTGVVCIMLDGNLKFKVEYKVADKTNTAEIEVPKPSSDIGVIGSCKDKNGSQFISIAWGTNHSSNLTLVFTESKDGLTWTVSSLISSLYIDAEQFPNATDIGSTLTSNITLGMKPLEVPVNKSYRCYSNNEITNFTTTEDGSLYNLTVSLHVSGIQLQAFNKLQTKDKFVDEIHCDADKVADIVPIAVGCALAGLILIVLIAYIVGRRRRSASYQSV